jgi:four helix bundle protein
LIESSFKGEYMTRDGHRHLVVWQKALGLAAQSHSLARGLPSDERYELASQIKRAATSVPANIAEGSGRSHRREYLHFLAIARGSAAELQTYLELLKALEYGRVCEVTELIDLTEEVRRMLTAMIVRLRTAPPPHQ